LKYRQLGTTDLNVSEVGFGVWTVATNWWGKRTEQENINLLVKAYDLGVNFYDTADTYSDGYGEEILAKALRKQRHDILIGTKFGYDIYSPFEQVGHQERPQKWTTDYVRYACEQSLRRLETDYIDLFQLHNPKMDAIEQDELFDLLDELVKEGKIRHYGAALGPDIGWFEEGEAVMKHRNVPSVQVIYSLIEQQPARQFFPIAREEQTGLLSRVPHASGLLDGTFTKDTVFDSTDHRSYRKQDWLDRALVKLERLAFLTEHIDATIGQIAIKFTLSGEWIACVLPNITSQEQLQEFVAAPESEEIPADDLQLAWELFDDNFGLPEEAESTVAD
jgi:aryl-alcohol dehydrogenase-like predicted oxidoreductase